MTDTINLRQERKKRAQQARGKIAAENRIKFGRTKSEKDLAKNSQARQSAHLDGHELPKSPKPE